MAGKKKIPMGIENFEEMRTQDYYYIDKTGLIKDFLENLGKVNLFTRPRRFGKTLNMSMLKYFFDIGSCSVLFDGLEISKEKELCREYMGKFPVISITLKSVGGRTFEEAKGMLRRMIGKEVMKFHPLMQSDKLSEIERRQYEALVNIDETGVFTMSDELLKDSLLTLSQLLEKHYGQRVVMLIDEYDVPLDAAYRSGYYDDMAELVRSLFGGAFKTNDSLSFAVLTGCLRVSKESIFSGLNNFNVYTVKDVQYNEYFGFTDAEVRRMLEYYEVMEKYDLIREWYDGYRFGELDIYCPWDVVNYCHALKMQPSVNPQNYWVNTSSNDIIRRFINKAKTTTRDELELLVDGGSVKKLIRQELTYRDFDSDIDNLWSILFTTGYLTQCDSQDGDLTELVIPNKEIRWIFVSQIQEWFKEEAAKDTVKLENFCRAFQNNDTAAIEKGFNEYLWNTISIRDTGVRKEMKENFYHGILLGLLSHRGDWDISSNAESGIGYSDILVETGGEKEIGIVIEIKYPDGGNLETGCIEALKQIEEKEYSTKLIEDGMETIIKYGIACWKKKCKVIKAIENL